MKIAERRKVWLTIFLPSGGYTSERLWSEKTEKGRVFYDAEGHKRVLIELEEHLVDNEKGNIN